MTATNDEAVQEIMAQLAAARLQIELMAKQIELMGNEIEQYKGMHRRALDRVEKWMYMASDLLNEKAEALNAKQAEPQKVLQEKASWPKAQRPSKPTVLIAEIMYRHVRGIMAPEWHQLASIERDMFVDCVKEALDECQAQNLWEGSKLRSRLDNSDLQRAQSEHNKMMQDVLSGSKLSDR